MDFTEVVDFWSTAMSDDTALIAQYLDPQEQDLIGQALDSSAVFKGFHPGNLNRKLPGGEVVVAVVVAIEELIDFATIFRDGITAGHASKVSFTPLWQTTCDEKL